MLYCNRIDISERIDPTKSSNAKECINCSYWFFKHGSNFNVLYAVVVMILAILCPSTSAKVFIIVVRKDLVIHFT